MRTRPRTVMVNRNVFCFLSHRFDVARLELVLVIQTSVAEYVYRRRMLRYVVAGEASRSSSVATTAVVVDPDLQRFEHVSTVVCK